MCAIIFSRGLYRKNVPKLVKVSKQKTTKSNVLVSTESMCNSKKENY